MPTRRKNVRPSFVVIIQRSEYETEVIGPYASFKHADADAQAMGGSCYPLTRINLRTGELTSIQNGGFAAYERGKSAG